MNTKRTWLNLAFAFVLISVASLTLTVWTTQYRYLHFKNEETFYLSSSEESRSIELPLREGAIIEARTELISGDIDIDLVLLIIYNDTYDLIPANSSTINSSKEKILWENQINDQPETPLLFQYVPVTKTYQYVYLMIRQVAGSGIIRIRYEVLLPAPELLYFCIFGIIFNLTYFIKNFGDLINSLNDIDRDGKRKLVFGRKMSARNENSHIKIEKIQLKKFVPFLLGGIVIGLTCTYLSLEILNLFLYTVILELIIISLILLSYSIQDDKITPKHSFEKSYLIWFLLISIVIMLFANIVMMVILFSTMCIFILRILGRITRSIEYELFFVLLMSILALIGCSLITIVTYPELNSTSVTMIIDGTLSFMFINILYNLTTVKEMPRHQKKNPLKEKTTEVFDEKVCEFHPLMKVKEKCPKCGNAICELCLVDFEDSCVLCYCRHLKNIEFIGFFLQRLGILVLFVFITFHILGTLAPLPLLKSTVPWLAYHRAAILLYFVMTSTIISIMFIGGGYYLSRGIKDKIKDIESEILDKSFNPKVNRSLSERLSSV